MTLIGELRTRARHIIGPVLAATVFVYFAYHAIQGDRGLLAWIKLGQQVEEARLELAQIDARRDALAQQVHYLHPESLDPDLLEERIRVVLGYVAKNDVVIAKGVDGHYVTGVAPDEPALGTVAQANVDGPGSVAIPAGEFQQVPVQTALRIPFDNR